MENRFPVLTDYQDKMDVMYPNRHKTIHKVSCEKCPSENNRRCGIIDIESDDIAKLPKDVISKEYLFVCAWRPSKLCKGNCDDMLIDQKYLDELYHGER